MKIAIIGAGNAGCAYAWYLAANGHSVRLLKTSTSLHEDNFQAIQDLGGISGMIGSVGEDWTFAPLEVVTRRESDAVTGADAVIVLVQTLFHETVAKRIAPYLKGVGLVLVVPGYMGSLYFRRECDFDGVAFGEGESSALDARIERPGAVRILFRNVRNALAMLPATTGGEGMDLAGRMFDTYSHTRVDIIESALHNPNLILHPLGTILSASRIEYSNGDFRMYAEAFTPSVWDVASALDEEKMAILRVCGFEPTPYVEACRFRNSEDLGADPMEVFRGYAVDAPRGPSSLDTRYLDEDVPMGLVLMSSLGERCGVKTPVCDALVSIGGALRRKNFWMMGRTLTQLGLGELSLEQTEDLVRGAR